MSVKPEEAQFFNVLRYSIEDLITRRWPGLSYELLIPCPGDVGQPGSCAGSFPVDGLMRLRERGFTTIPCMKCAQVQDISVLLTGFPVSSQPITAELEEMHAKLARIEDGVARTERQAAATAESVRRVLKVVSIEVTDCPRLFTLTPDQSKGKRLRIFQRHYRLTLWCEHPGYWHSWPAASYEIDPPRDWLGKILPYARLVLKTLRLAVPVAGLTADLLLDPAQLDHAQAELEMMNSLLEELPEEPRSVLSSDDLSEAASQLTTAEGQSLRLLRSVLYERDRKKAFGGMRRVLATSGDFLWVCTDHYPKYDPGLPTLPQDTDL